MNSPEMKKAPALGGATGAINTANTIPYQEEGVTMTTSVPRIPAHFDTAIQVAGLTVAPGVMTGGTKPDESVVTLTTRDELLSFTPAEACALAAALQAVAVHVMEQADTEQKAA